MSKSEKIIGRKEEQALLLDALRSKTAEFLAVYGRRRIGKTFLIKTLFESQPCAFMYVSGMKNGALKQQLRNFADAIEQSMFEGFKFSTPRSWMEAFQLLTDTLKKYDTKKKVVLFLDELPWLATKRSKCLESLDYYWNRHWSHDPRFKLVVCGSAASWIIRNIIQNKGGLYNRITNQFQLGPFSLKETKDFLSSKKIAIGKKQILEIYLATGGIPYYLSHVKKNQSATQVISNMAFAKNGILYQDFDILFSSLFDAAEEYEAIVKAIAKYRYGIEQEKLFKECKVLSKGGSAVEKLRDLEEAGFIISFLPHGHKKRGIYYRIIDEYVNFYLKWIEPTKKSAHKLTNAKEVWTTKRTSPSWHSWSGYAFETVCLKHIPQIQNALSIEPSAIAATWRQDGRLEEGGAQIDLLFDRVDDAITVCEIKYTLKPFKIDKSYSQEIQNKIALYRKATKTHKEVFLAFISVSGLQETMYSEELVSGLVTLEDLFT